MAVQIAPWLLAMAWPLVKKVLLMLGIGWATYEGMGVLVNQGAQYLVQYWGQAPMSVIQVGSMSGVAQAIGIILGAMTARVSYTMTARLTKIAT